MLNYGAPLGWACFVLKVSSICHKWQPEVSNHSNFYLKGGCHYG